MTDYQVFTAQTEASESANVKARVTGYLTDLICKDGAMVHKGDDLFKIDERPYKAALDQATAALAVAEAALNGAKSALEAASGAWSRTKRTTTCIPSCGNNRRERLTRGR